MIERRKLLTGMMGGLLGGAMAGLPLQAARAADRSWPPLYLQRIADDIWMHVSWIDYGNSFGSSNGLVVRCGDRVVLIDTPCTEAYTDQLLDRITMPVDRLVITHAHSDRIAGIARAHARGIPSLLKDIGAPKARALGYAAPTMVWSGTDSAFAVNGRRFELFYPGGAHSFDNVVVYLPDHRLLFGGCMLRPGDATSPGGTQFSDVCHWSKALRAVELRFPGIRQVVPGHGQPGGPDLIRHTARVVAPVFEQRGCD